MADKTKTPPPPPPATAKTAAAEAPATEQTAPAPEASAGDASAELAKCQAELATAKAEISRIEESNEDLEAKVANLRREHATQAAGTCGAGAGADPLFQLFLANLSNPCPVGTQEAFDRAREQLGFLGSKGFLADTE